MSQQRNHRLPRTAGNRGSWGYTTSAGPLFELVAVDQLPPQPQFECPEDLREHVMVDVIHDGDMIPADFLVDASGGPIPDERFLDWYVHERDWGASLVAAQLAARLRLPGFFRVNVARVLMDFGRFPGATPPGAGHLDRMAISYPFSELLNHGQKKRVLERCYDSISQEMERAVSGHFIKFAIHTYDRYNESGTERPQVSIVTRSTAYQTHSRLPLGVFDPLFPDILVEFCADRILRDRISLTLEKAGIPVEHNYPYALPEGSIEVRAQVWFFFRYLREAFEAKLPETAGDPSFEMVWDLLLDTNLRSADSDGLRSALHMFRKVPPRKSRLYREARSAYERIARFLEHNDREVVEQYRFSLERPSTLGIEVRKDLVYDFDANGLPVAPRPERAARIADTIAMAVAQYLRSDRRRAPSKPMEFHHSAVWPRPEHA